MDICWCKGGEEIVETAQLEEQSRSIVAPRLN